MATLIIGFAGEQPKRPNSTAEADRSDASAGWSSELNDDPGAAHQDSEGGLITYVPGTNKRAKPVTG